MNLQQQIIYQNKEYIILSAEREFITHPICLQLLPATMNHVHSSYSSTYSIRNYQLYLDQLNPVTPTKTLEDSTDAISIENLPLYYNGAIIIACDPIKDYPYLGISRPYFSYKYVYELIFNKGILETTIEHSRSMLRIRKNLELELRDLNVKRDVRCIRRFMDSIIIGDYKGFSSDKKRLKYLLKLKEYYPTIEK